MHAGIGDEVAAGKVVGAVADQIVGFDQRLHVAGVEADRVRLHADLRIERQHRLARGLYLAGADASSAVRDLALQVGEFDHVVIDQPDGADAGRGEIQRQRRAQSTGAHHQHTRSPQPGLADAADLGEQDMPGIALHFLIREGERIRSALRRKIVQVHPAPSAGPRKGWVRDHEFFLLNVGEGTKIHTVATFGES